MKILNFGSCNIDYVYRVEHFVRPGETLNSNSMSKFPGGKGLNQSIAMSRSGLKVYHAGCIGDDGIFLKELLENEGVNTSCLKVLNTPSGQAIIQVDSSGENCIILFGGANQKTDTSYVDEVLKDFSCGDWLVLQNEISNIKYIIDAAYSKGMKIILNPSPFNDLLSGIDLSKLHTLILNKVEAQEFAKSSDINEISRYFAEKYTNLSVVLTLGSKGSIYIDKNETQSCPVYPIDVVDTTAAGDTFTGYYIFGLVNGMGVGERLYYATVAAALAVSKTGAAPSIPRIDDVKKIIKR